MCAIHGFAMARDRGLEWQCPDFIERLAPRGRAGGLEEWCRQRHEIADDGDAARAVVKPDIRVSYRAVGDPDIERPAGDARLAAPLDDDIGTQDFAFGHGRDEDPDFVLLGLAQLRVVEHLARGLEITGEESAFREDAIDRIRRVHRCSRVSGLDAAIAACVVQVPVRVHDRGDRPVFRPGKREDGVAVPGVPAGVDDDEPLRRVEDDRVSIRSALGKHGAAQEFDTGSDLLRRGNCDIWFRRGRQPNDRGHERCNSGRHVADLRRATKAAQNGLRPDVRNASPTGPARLRTPLPLNR